MMVLYPFLLLIILISKIIQKIGIFYMQNSTQKRFLLNNEAINTTHSPANMTQCYKSPTSNQHYLASNISPNRTTSPSFHLKTKIRLVSPQGHFNATIVMPKENNPPSEVLSKFYRPTKTPLQIELGGRPPQGIDSQKMQINQANAKQIVHYHQNQKKYVNSSMNAGFKHPPPLLQPKEHQRIIKVFRPISPQRVSINNKTFDIGAIKEKIVYVNPQLQKLEQKKLKKKQPARESTNQLPKTQTKEKKLWPDHMVILQQSNLESLKDSYDFNIKEIQQLQSEIQQNSQEIKELLQNSRVSKNSSKKHIESQQQLKIEDKIQNANFKHKNNHSQTDFNIKRDNQGSRKITESIKVQSQTPTIGQKKEALCSHQTLINELDFTAKHIESRNYYQMVKLSKDQASVQTESNENSTAHESNSAKVESKLNRLTLTQNAEYSIKIMNSAFLELQMQKKNVLAYPSSTKLKTSVIQKRNDQRGDLNLCSQPSLAYLLKNQTHIIEKQEGKIVKQQVIQKQVKSVQSVQQNAKINKSMSHKSIKEIGLQNKQSNNIAVSTLKISKASSNPFSQIQMTEQKQKVVAELVKTQSKIKKSNGVNLETESVFKNKSVKSINQIQKKFVVPKVQVQHSIPSAKGKQRRFSNKIYL